jgi:ornithine carbamoyltransferase
VGRHNFLSIKDFSPEEIRYLLELAHEMKSHPSAHTGVLKGKTLAMIFEKPSLRTRVSFDVGIQQLGGFSLYLSNAEINLGKRESVYDVAKNLERMVQAIMIRTYAHEIVERMAEYADIPIINGLTDYSHPCQAMADYLTIQELKGDVAGLKVAFADVCGGTTGSAGVGGHASGIRAKTGGSRMGSGTRIADRRDLHADA